jgi:cytochrome c-type biogenesis protein CcmH
MQMTEFAMIALGMIVLAIVFLVLPLRRVRNIHAGQADENLQLLRAEMAQLDIEEREGRLPELASSMRLELQRRLLEEERAIAADGLDAGDAGSPGLGSVGAGQDRVPVGAVSPSTQRTLALRWVLGLLILLGAVGLYGWVGNPLAIEVARTERAELNVGIDRINSMVQRLEQRLEKGPGTAQEWQMLARSYAVLQRVTEALTAYAKALEMDPNNAEVMLDYADILAFQSKSAQGEPLRLIEAALKIAPDNLKGLALAGTAYFEVGDFARAEQFWTQALQRVPPDTEVARQIQQSIDDARRGALEKKGAAAPGS